MAFGRKILAKPSGAGFGQAVRTQGGYYPMQSSLAFFRDEFNALDVDEWTVGTGVGTGNIAAAAGFLTIRPGTAVSGVQVLTSVDKYYAPFRVTFAARLNDLSANSDVYLRVKDSAETYLAEWRFLGSAAGNNASAHMQVRSGSTAAGFIASAAGSVTAMSGSTNSSTASYMYTIDVDYNGVSFAFATAGASTTLTYTTVPPPPLIQSHFVSPLLDPGKAYYIEAKVNTGTAAISTTNQTADTQVQLDFIEVRQYAPDGSLQRPAPQHVFALTSSAGTATVSATAGITGSPYLKWY